LRGRRSMAPTLSGAMSAATPHFENYRRGHAGH
jgi:hypothetical protein